MQRMVSTNISRVVGYLYIYISVYIYICIYICMLKAIIPNLIGHFLLVESLINPQEIVM